MAGARSRQTVPDSPVTSTGPRVDGSLLQLMRVLVDIAGNTPSADAGDHVQTDPAVRRDDSTHAATPAGSPHAGGTHTRGRPNKDNPRVTRHAPSCEPTESSATLVRAKGG